jgi:hypothetical protein
MRAKPVCEIALIAVAALMASTAAAPAAQRDAVYGPGCYTTNSRGHILRCDRLAAGAFRPAAYLGHSVQVQRRYGK